MKNNWKKEGKMLTKTFTFKNFLEVVQFVNQLAEVAEKDNHHPDLLIFDYRKLKVMLTTHSAGGVTEKDHDLAKKIDSLWRNLE